MGVVARQFLGWSPARSALKLLHGGLLPACSAEQADSNPPWSRPKAYPMEDCCQVYKTREKKLKLALVILCPRGCLLNMRRPAVRAL